MASKREYGLVLLAGAVGGGLVVVSVRQRWAQAVFTPPRPLSSQTISVTGTDLVPLAGALAIAALACLAAVIATRGWVRRASGAVLAAFGIGAAVAAGTAVSAASVLSVAASQAGAPGAAAVSGAAGSATGGTVPGGAGSPGVSLIGTTGQAIMSGTPWQAAVILGAALVVAAGVATAWRGPRWPVMSARFDAPGRRPGSGARGAPAAATRDSASMWESLSAGADPTDVP
jgi:Tryptophan-associated transmembrane protein (Trp_oprn_chp)